MTDKQLGIVSRWFADKGYGFIRTAAENFKGEIVPVNERSFRDIFLHIKTAQRDGIDDIGLGDVLEFDVAIDPRSGKPHAVSLVRVKRRNDAEEAA